MNIRLRKSSSLLKLGFLAIAIGVGTTGYSRGWTKLKDGTVIEDGPTYHGRYENYIGTIGAERELFQKIRFTEVSKHGRRLYLQDQNIYRSAEKQSLADRPYCTVMKDDLVGTRFDRVMYVTGNAISSALVLPGMISRTVIVEGVGSAIMAKEKGQSTAKYVANSVKATPNVAARVWNVGNYGETAEIAIYKGKLGFATYKEMVDTRWASPKDPRIVAEELKKGWDPRAPNTFNGYFVISKGRLREDYAMLCTHKSYSDLARTLSHHFVLKAKKELGL